MHARLRYVWWNWRYELTRKFDFWALGEWGWPRGFPYEIETPGEAANV